MGPLLLIGALILALCVVLTTYYYLVNSGSSSSSSSSPPPSGPDPGPPPSSPPGPGPPPPPPAPSPPPARPIDPNRWVGYNIMPGGYSIKCLDAVMKTQNNFIRIRNNLSSYLNPSSPNYWEKNVRDFLESNSANVQLYTCLEWNSESDLDCISQMSFLTHAQANGGTYFGPPLSKNPTEDNLTTLPGFVLQPYLDWLTKMDTKLPSSVVIVIPFKPYSTAVPGDTLPSEKMMGQILSHCAQIQQKNQRPFAVETTIYPFWAWNQPSAPPNPDKQVLYDAFGAFQKVASDCKTKYGFPGRLDPVICETGWPVSCAKTTGHGPTITSLENAQKYWQIVRAYPAPTNFLVFYWQFQNVDNGDSCGSAWGIINPETCALI